MKVVDFENAGLEKEEEVDKGMATEDVDFWTEVIMDQYISRQDSLAEARKLIIQEGIST